MKELSSFTFRKVRYGFARWRALAEGAQPANAPSAGARPDAHFADIQPSARPANAQPTSAPSADAPSAGAPPIAPFAIQPGAILQLASQPAGTQSAAAPPLVLVHGFAQSTDTWDEVAPMLARGRTAYALDLIGQGRSCPSEDPADYTLEAAGDALLAFLEFVKDESAAKPVVVGYSMGGRLALAAACRDPRAFCRRASALILESAGLGPADQRERSALKERNGAWAARLRADGVEPFMDAWQNLPLFATQRDLPDEARSRLRAGRLSHNAEALALTLEGMGAHAMPDSLRARATFDELARQGLPALFLAGARDEKYCAIASSLRGVCAVRVIEGSGHNVHLEAPKAFVRAIDEWCATASIIAT